MTMRSCVFPSATTPAEMELGRLLELDMVIESQGFFLIAMGRRPYLDRGRRGCYFSAGRRIERDDCLRFF